MKSANPCYLLLYIVLSYYFFLSCSYAERSIPHTDDIIFPPQTSDVLISEILANPRAGGAEFIEIYNYSDKIIDLQDLQIARINSNDSLINIRQISTISQLFFPKEYRVLTKDPVAVRRQYQTKDSMVFTTISNLIQLPNVSGGIALLHKRQLIDRLDYNQAMHDPLVKEQKGVSLERKNFELPANAPGNFTSATASVGYATPGYENSQLFTAHNGQTGFWLSAKTFSPDNDGRDDELQINYRFGQNTRVANIYIYNDQGKMVRQLCKNYSLAASGVISWDGLSDNHQRLPIGIYFIYIEIYNAIDGVKKYHESCTLTAKF